MVDLSSAFDWCKRPWVFESMRHVIGDSKLIDLLENMYSKTTAYLRGKTDEVFKSTCGVRQGGTESPVGYNCLAQMAMDTFVDRCKIEGLNDFSIPYEIPISASKNGEKLKGYSIINWLGYADDLVLWAFDRETLEKKTKILWDVFIEFGLCMNLEKTETLILNWENGEFPVEKPKDLPENFKIYPNSLFEINDFPIKNSTDFKYLGGTLQVDDSSVGNLEIENRITAGTCKFYELKPFFSNNKIYLSSRVAFFRSLVMTRLTYLCQTWTITNVQTKKLQSTICQLLRSMVKGGQKRLSPESYTRQNGTTAEFSRYRFSNEEILKIAKMEPVSEYILKQQTNWIGHCVRAEDTTFIKQLVTQGLT